MKRAGKELEGKVCVITGGGRGIGAAIATTFAAHGARIAVLEREAALAEQTRARLAAEDVDVRAYVLDVTDEAGVVETAKKVASDFGKVDVLVNNAGISRLGPSMSFSTKDFRDSLEVLTVGVFLCSREFGKQIRASGGGSIVNISSINGLVAFPMRLAYSAAKAAVISMTEVLATEWSGYGIRVNAVAPGIVKTEMVQQVIDEGLIDTPAYIKHTPLRRFGLTEEVAEAVLFLASDRSSFTTGQTLMVDGGWTKFAWIPWSGDPDAPGITRS